MAETLSALWEYAPVLIPALVASAFIVGVGQALGRITDAVFQGRIREGLKWAVILFFYGLMAYVFAAWTIRSGMDVF